ncbi:MAG: peptide deformylase [Pirellulales bacterium]|nr:peptide deformylase [Planctomycetales bacterium]
MSTVDTLEIVLYPHPVLRHKSKPLRRVDADLRRTVDRMFELMYEHRGVGLAANQVALPCRLFVANVTGDSDQRDAEMVFINPVISGRKGSAVAEEGCLSLPEVVADVTRPATITASAYNLAGEEFKFEVDGLLARVIQHENDHLDGVMFTDHLSSTALMEIRDEIECFEADWASRQRQGEIADDATLAADLRRLEAIWT